MTLHAIMIFLQEHWASLTATLGVLAVATVCCMPASRPRTLDDWWTWLRDSLQTAVPAARLGHVNPTTPADPAKTQK